MKQILSEYGNTVIAAVAFLLIIAIGFTVPIMGERGLLAATGSKVEISGSASTGLSSADAIMAINNVDYEITDNTTNIKVGEKISLNSILTSTDTTAIFSVTSVKDEQRNDSIKNGDVTYDRGQHAVTFNKRGFYTIQVRASGKQLQRYSFVVYAE